MKTEVKNFENKKVSDIELPKDIFGVTVRRDILSRVIEWQLAKRRSGNHQTKGISAISGTTKKPFKQKGTGRARQGSLRSPQMRGGAVIFGPLTRDHGYDLQKKVRKLGLKCALAAKLADKKLIVLDSFDQKNIKTADVQKKIEAMGLTSALFIDGPEVNVNFLKSIHNLHGIDVLPTQGANVYDIMRHSHLILSQSAVENLEKRLK